VVGHSSGLNPLRDDRIPVYADMLIWLGEYEAEVAPERLIWLLSSRNRLIDLPSGGRVAATIETALPGAPALGPAGTEAA